MRSVSAGCPAASPCTLAAAIATADAEPGADVVQVIGQLGDPPT